MICAVNFCGLSAVEDARRVAQVLDISHYVMNFKRDFKIHVIDYFINEYQAGRTPNPCIACNRYVKWESLLSRSMEICFVPDGDYASYIEKAVGVKSEAGDFVDMQGHVLGRHRGIIHYTIGQRKGLNHMAEVQYSGVRESRPRRINDLGTTGKEAEENYKKGCLKRADRSFAQGLQCQQINSMAALMSLEDSVFISHSPQGCVGCSIMAVDMYRVGQALVFG